MYNNQLNNELKAEYQEKYSHLFPQYTQGYIIEEKTASTMKVKLYRHNLVLNKLHAEDDGVCQLAPLVWCYGTVDLPIRVA